MSCAALFLDRDGVINIDYGYVHKKDDFHFVDGVFELVREAVAKGYMIFIVTNQSGIGRGYYTEADFHGLTEWMLARFQSEGVVITKVYFSPYHPVYGEGRYKKEHSSRKPNPGMILQAANEFGLDLKTSVLIGDKSSDIMAGISAGVGKNLYLENYFYDKETRLDGQICIRNLRQAKNYI